jgi:hypothetical protein
MSGRSRGDAQAFNSDPNTGLMAFRYPGEAPDGRPVIAYVHPFWEDRMEEATYEAAVAGHPRRADEGPLAYAQRISELVTGEREQIKRMPRRSLSNRERDERLALLREQAAEGGK